MLLPAAVLSGALFPLAVRMVTEDPRAAGHGVGRMTAVNTLGGIVGALLAGFLGIPVFGLQATLIAVTGVSVVSGVAAWMWLDQGRPLRFRLGLAAASVAVWAIVPRAFDTRIPADFLGDRSMLVDYREGLGANLAVLRSPQDTYLEIDREWQGTNLKNHQVMAAHVPMLLHDDPSTVLVIGVGTGQTPSRFLMYDIDRLDCVDIEPAIFDFIQPHFESSWMDDPRVRLIRDDGRNYVSNSSATYDVISIEVGQIFRPGVPFFYTRDFYARARARLAPSGLLVQFVPLPFFTAEQFASVLRTFTAIFPQAALWYNTSELLLLGVNDNRLALGAAAAARMSSIDAIHEDLAYSHWGGVKHRLNQPHVFAGSFLTGPRGLAALASTGDIYGDDRPILDYQMTDVDENAANEIPLAQTIARHLEGPSHYLALDLDQSGWRSAEEIRRQNLNDLIASGFVRKANLFIRSANVREASQDLGTIARLLSEAVRHNPDNAVANRMLADALLYQGRYREAEGYYETAVALRPDDARALYGLGMALYQTGRVDESIPRYEAALLLQPDDAELHNNLGAALGRVGRMAEAARHFETAVRLRPDFTGAINNLARMRAAARKDSK